MKRINKYITEKFRIEKDFGQKQKITPEEKSELQKIIYDRLNENGSVLELNDIDISKINDLSDLFDASYNPKMMIVKEIHVELWKTDHVIDMGSLFNECENLTSLDLSRWDVSNVENFEYMFRRCLKLKKVDLSNWDVQSVRDMEKMFFRCYRLETIKGDIENWNVKSLNFADSMFTQCKALRDVNLSKWRDKTPTRVDFYKAFDDCHNSVGID